MTSRHWAARRTWRPVVAILVGALLAACDYDRPPHGFEIENDTPDAVRIVVVSPDGVDHPPPYLDRDSDAVLQPGASRYFPFSEPDGCASGDVVARRDDDGTEVARILAPACGGVRPLSMAVYPGLQARLPSTIAGRHTNRFAFAAATVIDRRFGDPCHAAPCAMFSPEQVLDLSGALGVFPEDLRLADMRWFTESLDQVAVSVIEVPPPNVDALATWVNLQVEANAHVTHTPTKIGDKDIEVIHDANPERTDTSLAWTYAYFANGDLMLLTFVGGGPRSEDSVPAAVATVLAALP